MLILFSANCCYDYPDYVLKLILVVEFKPS